MTLCGILFLLLLSQTLSFGSGSMVKLTNGGYEDIVFAINPGVREDEKIIDNIKSMVKEASSYLFRATQNRLFIRSVKILIPFTWPKKSYVKVRTETYDKADIIIASSHVKYGNDPYTLQYGQCGEKGRYIHFTPDFLANDNAIYVYGPRGRVFVHEWAHLRWGVFDEYNNDVPFYISSGLTIEATRCPTELKGIYREYKCTNKECKCAPRMDTGLYDDDTCVFVPDISQTSQESIMYLQALNDVTAFCDSTNHNAEAPNLQNRMCNYHSTWDVIKNSSDILSTPQTTTPIPEPTFSLLQASDRVVTLVLDVSGSMSGYNRINRLYQAAEVFLIQIVEQGSFVGIVKFESTATILSSLVHVFSDQHRQQLKALLPRTASGGTNICAGLTKGIEVNKGTSDKSSYGTELVVLSDGEDSSFPTACYSNLINSGAIIHVIALGPSAAKGLEQITQETGGLNFYASDNIDANSLIDAFSAMTSGSGYEVDQTIQLESTGASLTQSDCLKGDVFIDKTVGNETFFLVTYETVVPSIELQTPNGALYTGKDFKDDTATKSSRLQIPGSAEVGPWRYTICNTHTTQAIGITVTSKAVDKDVPPVTVNAHMDKDANNYPSPMVVYASVHQGFVPVINAKVTAIIEPTTGAPITLELLDNGSGPDIVKNDGIYSRYLTTFTVNGRYGLKVRVESTDNKARLTLPRNRALYVPGYVDNGNVTMNPPRPQISEDDLKVGLFSRTASGSSFVVSNVPVGPQPDIYKPEKITDLVAKIEEETIVLSWTATGDDLDQGNATGYDLRMSVNPRDLRDNFDSAVQVNISSLTPLPAGSTETFTFVPENVAIKNGTILYFAIIAFDKADQKSDVSNTAQAALFIPPTPEPTTPEPPTTSEPPKTPEPTPNDNSENQNLVTLVTLIICSTVILICIIINITICCVSCHRKKRQPEMRI
ncbi:calcium-activated chloride channel regulator 1-like [Lithobates pipiens]